MNEIYVDDEDVLLEAFRRGVKWNGSRLEYKEVWEAEDNIANEEDDKRTMKELCKMVNSLDWDVQMEATSYPRK